MRHTELPSVLMIAALGCLISSVNAQDPLPSPAAPVGINGTDRLTNPQLPRIPLSLLFQLPYGGSTAEAIGLTRQQLDSITAGVTAHQVQKHPMQLVRADLDKTRLANHRFLLAAAEYLDELDVQRQVELQRLLTTEQQSKLHQLRHREIALANQVSSRPTLVPFGGAPLGDYLAADDLLSVLILPEIQQKLQLTDKQLMLIENARTDAYPAARDVILTVVQTLRPQAPEPDPRIKPLLEGLYKDWYGILTNAQRSRLDAFMQARKDKPVTPAEQAEYTRRIQAAEIAGNSLQICYSYTDGLTICNIKLPILYAEPAVQRTLELTPEQQVKFVRLLGKARESIQQFTAEQQTAQTKIAVERQQKLRDLVLSHNRKYQARLTDVLTSEQSAVLHNIQWRGMGLAALLRPQVAAQLRLSEAQQAAISRIFDTPGPQMQPPPQPGDLAEFHRNTLSYQLRLSQRSVTIAAKIWRQLTPEQAEQLEQLTGLTAPTPRPKSCGDDSSHESSADASNQ